MLKYFQHSLYAALLLYVLSGGISAAQQLEGLPAFVLDFLQLAKGTSPPHLGKSYATDFETLDEFKGQYIVPQNHMNSATHMLSVDQHVSGLLAHKAIIYKKNPIRKNENTNHRAYPALQFKKTPLGIVQGAVLVEFFVWADIPLRHAPEESWFSLATFTSYDDINWYRTYLINVDADDHIHLMHVPQHGQAVHDIYQTQTVTLPKRQWVKITAYIDYTADNRFQAPFLAVWQDGVLVSAARFDNRVNVMQAQQLETHPPCVDTLPQGASVEQAEVRCGLVFTGGLAQAHFGLYAPPALESGVIYNDRLRVSEVLR